MRAMRYKRVLAFSLTLISSVLYVEFHHVRDYVSWHLQREMCEAAAEGDISRMKLLLSIGAVPHGWNSSFEPIIFAAQSGQTEAVRFLLDKGADVNSHGKELNTPLSDAAEYGHFETVRLLLSKGADVRPQYGQLSALCGAAENGYAGIVRLLLAHGAGEDKDDVRALRAAVTRRQPEVVRILLARGVEVNDKTYYPSVLADAIEKGNQEIIGLLKRAGAKE